MGNRRPLMGQILLLSGFFAVVQGCSLPQEQKRPEPSSVLEERMRDAQVTTRRLDSGATITEVRFAGSLQPNFDLGCIPIQDVTSKMNPPSLVHAAKKCMQQGQYEQGWVLMTTGLGFAYYDLKRLADRSTQGARDVLLMNAFADVPTSQKEAGQAASRVFLADPAKVSSYCAELTRIGPPTYEPQWAILHGIGAYQAPRNGHYLLNVDSKALWEEVLKNRCTSPK